MPSAASARDRRLEARPLLAEERVIRIVGGRKVGVDGVDPQVRAGRDLGDRPIEVVVAEAEPVHAGVDLEMAPERDAAATRPPPPGRAPRRRGNRRRQAVLEDAVEVADAQARRRRGSAPARRLAQDDALFDVGAREHRRTGLLERARHLQRAVPVGVGLDHGDDRPGRGPVSRGEIADEGAIVARAGVEIDARDGRPDHDDPCARFSKRVNCLTNASLAVPIGPLRCLPMMISATPCWSGFGCLRRTYCRRGR